MKKIFASIISDFKDIQSTRKELKEFGIVFGIFFLILTGIGLWRQKNYIPMGSISAVFFILAFTVPQILLPLQKIWMGFAVIMGFFMSRLILLILFFIVLTPIGLISRLTGKRFLDLNFRKDLDSYWVPRPKEPLPKTHYERQF